MTRSSDRRNTEPLDTSLPSLSETRPVFVDNRAGNSLDHALTAHLRALRQDHSLPWGVDIASAFFNVGGFDLLAEELEQVGHVRLLLGAEPRPEAERPVRALEDPPEPAFTQAQVAESLGRLAEGLAHGRDLLPFSEECDRHVRRLLDFLRSGRIEVRRYTRGFLHAKAYIVRRQGGGAIVGSSNLTYAGLRTNRELNLGQYADPVVGRVEGWFDELWGEAEPFDLASIYDRLMAEFSPFLIYLRILFELYGNELEEEHAESGDLPLTGFQQHGVWRARRIIDKFGGVIVADGVGLGKTFIAGEIIRQYQDDRRRVLLVCPAALRDSTWRDFAVRFQVFLECKSYEQLANERQLGGNADHLRMIDEYSLVVIDEAHNYRNPDAEARAGVLRRLLMGQRRDVLMLTATPVNNSLWDLYHLLKFFVKQDAAFADQGVLSMRDRFEDADSEDPFNLHPDLLYPIIDATTVKRTRQFIKRNYQNDLIRFGDGVPRPIRFPRPIAKSINYTLDEVLPGFIDDLEEALGPEHGDPLLKMARYQPDRYRLDAVDEEEAMRYRALVGLLRSGLLKRFESSVYAFATTCDRMIRDHQLFLETLQRGLVLRKELFRELSGDEDEEAIEELMSRTGFTEPASQYEVEVLRADVAADLGILEEMAQRAHSVRPDQDPKLESLVAELERIAADAERESHDPDTAKNRRKVLVFSAYSDSVFWIRNFLDQRMDRDARLRPYRGRLAIVAGEHGHGGISRERAVYGFAPRSAAPRGRDEADEFDLLISTDVLAEGMNLQQCRNIINYDLPWNPMRLVQRHGRIDRIGSDHAEVYLRTFFPDDQLDRLLNLEHRVRRKLAQAAASVGVETTPIERGAERDQSFTEAREEIARLLTEDSSLYEAGGTRAGAQTGEEYRQVLRRAMAQRADEIVGLPWKAGSGMAKGDRRGHLFCAKVEGRHHRRVFLRFVPFDGTDIIHEIGTCLRIVECDQSTPRVMPDDLRQTAYVAWERAWRDIFRAWEHETDPRNLQPRVPRLNLEIAAFMRSSAPPDVDQGRWRHCLDAIEAPCSYRDQKALREVFEGDYPSASARAEALMAKIEELGLEPFLAPEPLPPISPGDVSLICWMAIESE